MISESLLNEFKKSLRFISKKRRLFKRIEDTPGRRWLDRG